MYVLCSLLLLLITILYNQYSILHVVFHNVINCIHSVFTCDDACVMCFIISVNTG